MSRSRHDAAKPDVSQILKEAGEGCPGAVDRLFSAVYDELRRMGRQQLGREAPGNTLETTALVNECYLRLAGDEGKVERWENRRHFFGAAAEAMRRILVDHARQKRARKRGGGRGRVPLEDDVIASTEESVDLVALDEALKRLEERDPRKSAVVKHRYFLGLTVPEIAKCLGVSARTVDDDWAMAKAWLRREIGQGD